MKGKLDITTGERAHEIANYLGIPYGAAWKVAKCVLKASFPTEERARQTADEWNQDVYRCPICGSWHTTSRDGNAGQRDESEPQPQR